MPGGTFDISSAPPNEIIDIFLQPRAPTLLNITAPLNSTEPILGLPINPTLSQNLRLRCERESTPPFKGGQLMYSLLSELSDLWKSADNPVLLAPIHIRNVPFYSIEIVVTPAGYGRILDRTKIAIYLYLLVEHLVNNSMGIGRWPALLRCDLKFDPLRLTIGQLDVNMIPITTLGSESNSTERNISSNSYIAGTAWEVAGNANLGTDGIDVHQIFTGTKTTDMNVLYLFTRILLPIFGRPRELRVTTLLPPGVLTRDIRSSDGTFRIRMQTYPAAAVRAFTIEELHEGLMRFLLRCAVEDRWESMAGDIIKDGNTVATVYLDLAQGSSAEASGQNWPA